MKRSDADLKTVFIKTYGCQMNVYDSERMTDVLAGSGYSPVETPEAADLILLNTCHIREKAAEKVYSELGRFRALKQAGRASGREVLVGVAGCVAQAEGAEIVARAPVVDLVVGPQSYQRLPELIAEARAGRRVVETEFDVADKFATLDGTTRGEERQRRDQDQTRGQEGRRPDTEAKKSYRLPHRSGRLRQVLHLLCRALYAGRRGLAAGGEDRRRSHASRAIRRARADAARPERQCLAWRRPRRKRLGARPAALSPGRNPRHRPPALHHQPPARHGRRSHRRPSRSG